MSKLGVSKLAFERVALVYNLSGRSMAEAAADELREEGIATEIFGTTAGGIEPNAEMLARNLEPGDVVGTVCGDGTFGTIVSAMRRPEVIEATNGILPICPLEGGNANDIRQSMHGRVRRAPSWVVQNGIVVPSYTIERSVTREGEVTVDEAVSYFGFGKTGEGSRRLASPEYRLGTFVVKDLKLGFASLFGSGAFDLVDNDGNEKRLGDLTAAKGRVMAKIGKFGVRHLEHEMIVAKTRPNPVSNTLGWTAIVAGLPYGEHTTRYGFTVLSPVLSHRDGEPPDLLPPSSEVALRVADDPYLLVTTRRSGRRLLELDTLGMDS